MNEHSLMELVYDAPANTLSVKWPDELSVESAQFFETLMSLFATIHEKRVKSLIVYSGSPAGGVLTEELIDYITRQVPGIPLQNIVLLESSDYLWDNNLYQVIRLLIATHRLPIAVKLAANQADAREWISTRYSPQPEPRTA